MPCGENVLPLRISVATRIVALHALVAAPEETLASSLPLIAAVGMIQP